MKTFILLLFLLTLGGVATVHAEDGNDLLRECTDALQTGSTTDFHAGLCYGNVTAVMDMLQVISPFLDYHICHPAIKNEQAVRIVVKHLHDHPEQLHFSAPVQVINALQHAFPCSVQR